MKNQPKIALFCLIIFSLSFLIRIYYINSSFHKSPTKADAGKYVSASYNLKYHKLYSEEMMDVGETPITKSILAKGYPIFLLPFIKDENIKMLEKPKNYKVFKDEKGYKNILNAQALLGALSVVLIFLISIKILPFKFALIPTILTSANPHLIMMTGYLLTETLFIFILTLGILLFIYAKEKSNLFLVFFSMFVIALSSQVREISMFLPLLLIPLYLIDKKDKYKKILVSFLAIIIVFSSSFIFNQIFTKTLKEPEKIKSSFEQIYSLKSRIKSIFTPTTFYQDKTKGITRSVIKDKGFIDTKFSEDPLIYTKYVIFGKNIEMWSFMDQYTNKIYTYDLTKSPFTDADSPKLLTTIYNVYKIIHWPLFLLTLTGIVFLFFKAKTLLKDQIPLLIILITFLYFYISLYIISGWLSRYTIPIRHFSYILATVGLIMLFQLISNKKKILKF